MSGISIYNSSKSRELFLFLPPLWRHSIFLEYLTKSRVWRHSFANTLICICHFHDFTSRTILHREGEQKQKQKEKGEEKERKICTNDANHGCVWRLSLTVTVLSSNCWVAIPGIARTFFSPHCLSISTYIFAGSERARTSNRHVTYIRSWFANCKRKTNDRETKKGGETTTMCFKGRACKRDGRKLIPRLPCVLWGCVRHDLSSEETHDTSRVYVSLSASLSRGQRSPAVFLAFLSLSLILLVAQTE